MTAQVRRSANSNVPPRPVADLPPIETLRCANPRCPHGRLAGYARVFSCHDETATAFCTIACCAAAGHWFPDHVPVGEPVPDAMDLRALRAERDKMKRVPA